MTRYAANLSMMFCERPLPERFAAAARAGFRAVELQFPYEMPLDDYAVAVREAGLPVVLLNLDPGDLARDFGLAALPGREADFDAALDKAFDYAAIGDTRILHAMAGLVPDEARAAADATYRANLVRAGAICARRGFTLVIEAINPRDKPGYFLSRTDVAAEILRAVGLEAVKMLFDVYHAQIVEGDLTRRVARHLPLIGHVQIAGAPERHEPDEGEVDMAHVLAQLLKLGYGGDIGCEYRPRGRTEDGLGWRDTLARRLHPFAID